MSFVLVVEDHEKIRTNVLLHLRESDIAAQAVPTGEEALALFTAQPPDVLIVDIRLAGKMSGVDLIAAVQERDQSVPVIVISGEATISETLRVLRLGIDDFIEKPFTRQRLVQSVHGCLANAELRRRLSTLEAQLGAESILGDSPAVRVLRKTIGRVAPTDARVLIRGESGSGKELVATAIHARSERRNGPLIRINCAAIPKHLIEDELFGHARGAFTDAKTAKSGLFEEAHRGTIFFDEIGDMEVGLQARLLRVLEDGRTRRIGENEDRAVDVRVIAATHRSLESLVEAGTFRQDLYFRLSAIEIQVPPLRDRGDDIALLARHFLDRFCREQKKRPLSVDPEVWRQLSEYHWPGNVRELRNVTERLVVFGTDPIGVDQLPAMLSRRSRVAAGLVRLEETPEILPLRSFRAQCEKEYLELVLRRTNWNVSEAARLLEIQRTHLHQKITALKISRQ
jgi:two-component system, NtrC family, nitrogen regulation response regulator NtrX